MSVDEGSLPVPVVLSPVELTDVPVGPHPDVVLKDLTTGWFETLKDAPLVTLDLAPEASWVAEYYPTEATTARPDGGLTVTLRVRDPGWLRGLLLGLRGGATVVAPEGAGSSAAEAAQEALDQYAALLDASTAG